MSTQEQKIVQLGDEYYLKYIYHSCDYDWDNATNIALFRHDDVCVKEITDEKGYFIDFPGVNYDGWERQLEIVLIETNFGRKPISSLEKSIDSYWSPCVRYACDVSDFHNGLVCFKWMVQPDGMNYRDSDGFGIEPYNTIWLYSCFDQNGNFTIPFSSEIPSCGATKNEYHRLGARFYDE